MLEFFKMYWMSIVVVFLFVLMLLLMVKRGKTDFVKKIIYALVVQAEQQLGSKTGDEKYAVVVSEVYKRLPLVLRILFTKEDIDLFIKESVAYLKAKLASGSIDLLSYSQEKTT